MQEQNPIVLMNFSGIYREEEFWKNRQVSWIELQDVCGTNCYCDDFERRKAEVLLQLVMQQGRFKLFHFAVSTLKSENSM